MSQCQQPEENLYEVLGLATDATSKQIRKAYLRKSLSHHPDKNPGNEKEARAQFVKIGQAYEILSDPVQKAQYDRELLRGGGATSWRERWEAAAAAAGSASSSGTNDATTNSSNADAAYRSYATKFDAFVSTLSEEELAAAAGIASVVGSIVGSIVGAKLGKNSGSVAGRALGTAGSLVGSIVGSRAGVDLVQSIHGRSVDRIAYEEWRREAMERGEAVPERPPPNGAGTAAAAAAGWDRLRKGMGRTMEQVASNVQDSFAVNGPDGTSARAGANDNNGRASTNDRWRNVAGAAASMASMAAAAAAANNGNAPNSGGNGRRR
mmetsp:Transcript_17966/g.51457  ORF Transcript_17966/g.51457 Transcript_17966/m.51457 type:complete len:322 (-) Transcript_17966:64-1029(-)